MGEPLSILKALLPTTGAFEAFGTIAFAYGGHNVVLEIQVQPPSLPLSPAFEPCLSVRLSTPVFRRSVSGKSMQSC